jgi:hypothetical protein
MDDLTVPAVTVSSLIAYTVGTLRGARIGWELFAGLFVISITVPGVLVWVAATLSDLIAS